MTREQFFYFFDVKICEDLSNRARELYLESRYAFKLGYPEYASRAQHSAAYYYQSAMEQRIALIGQRPPL